jgi:hypothetical protein
MTILRIDFSRPTGGLTDPGARALLLARRQVAEIVRGELRETDFMVEAPEGILVLLPETDARAVETPRRRLLGRIGATLAVDLGVEIRTIEPDDVLCEDMGPGADKLRERTDE